MKNLELYIKQDSFNKLKGVIYEWMGMADSSCCRLLFLDKSITDKFVTVMLF